MLATAALTYFGSEMRVPGIAPATALANKLARIARGILRHGIAFNAPRNEVTAT